MTRAADDGNEAIPPFVRLLGLPLAWLLVACCCVVDGTQQFGLVERKTEWRNCGDGAAPKVFPRRNFSSHNHDTFSRQPPMSNGCDELKDIKKNRNV